MILYSSLGNPKVSKGSLQHCFIALPYTTRILNQKLNRLWYSLKTVVKETWQDRSLLIKLRRIDAGRESADLDSKTWKLSCTFRNMTRHDMDKDIRFGISYCILGCKGSIHIWHGYNTYYTIGLGVYKLPSMEGYVDEGRVTI